MKLFNVLPAALLFAAVAFTACDNAGNNNEKGTVETARETDNDTREDGMEAKADAMETVFDQYTELRDELYDGDADGAKTQAREMKQSLSEAKTNDMTPEQVQNWNTWAQKLNEPLNAIEGAANVEAQRTAFSNLTPHVYEGIKAFGVDDEVYYYHCPMALNDKGAYWLSTEKEVRNPYFGDKMKTCGTSKETLAARRD